MYTNINRGKNANFSRDISVYDVLAAVREEPRVDIPLLTEIEQQQMAAWNATQQSYSLDLCVSLLVEMQAAATPDAVALVAGEQMLSYKELNQHANQLAHYLQALGVGPNVLVGLCVERSLDLVVSLLGILKAGGAYVPLDPSYPAERLAFMLEDAQVPVLVTRQRMVTCLASQEVKVVCLDTDAAVLAEQRMSDPISQVTAADLAYVIYTSGSTGQPKGVQITHSSLLNLVFWHQGAFNVTSADRATQLTSPAFDATGWELWPYLTIGASVYFPDEDTRIASTLLRDWLVNNGITITFLPTALAESVMALAWPSTTSLRLLLTGADTLHRFPSPTLPFTLINNYGPTEATVVTTSGSVVPAEYSDLPPPLGRPIANTQVYILDEYLKPVPIGEAGELYIGGAGLAKGYLNRPDLTAEKFISHPFSDDPDARLYKTGDMARYLLDGQIAFLGRIDSQVKIRGFRIELGEIEAVLNRHPAVRQAVVIAREDVPGEKHLVAYVVAVQQQVADSQTQAVPDTWTPLLRKYDVSVAELQHFLQARLPDYIVPAVFVVLDTLPLTPNGKVDRAALPEPDATNTARDADIAEPGTLIEEQISKILAQLLGLEQVGIDDNFFMLGGHSLLGTQVIARVADTFGVNLTLRMLFDAATVRQVSAEIERLLIAQLEVMSEDEALHLLEQEQQI